MIGGGEMKSSRATRLSTRSRLTRLRFSRPSPPPPSLFSHLCVWRRGKRQSDNYIDNNMARCTAVISYLFLQFPALVRSRSWLSKWMFNHLTTYNLVFAEILGILEDLTLSSGVDSSKRIIFQYSQRNFVFYLQVQILLVAFRIARKFEAFRFKRTPPSWFQRREIYTEKCLILFLTSLKNPLIYGPKRIFLTLKGKYK